METLPINKILQGNCRDLLKTLPDNCVDCIVTSPPYFGLRDYGQPEQIGLEESPEEYTAKLMEVFNGCYRVLKPTGTLWLNIGDTYAAYWGQKYGAAQGLSGTRINNGSAPPAKKAPVFSKSKRNVARYGGGNVPAGGDVKPKDLFGIPWTIAFALRSAGWYLRQDIIWNKPNTMPESVTDRCTKSHEYIFLLSKSAKYFYDAYAIKTPLKDSSVQRYDQDVDNQEGSTRVPGKTNGNMKAKRKSGNISRKNGHERGCPDNNSSNLCSHVPWEGSFANKRSVWTVSPKPFKEAHFATFPPDLIIDCIKAGCPENGIVLDPFMGAGTTAMVARKLNRNFIGMELNPEYIKIAEKRLKKELGMFL